MSADPIGCIIVAIFTLISSYNMFKDIYQILMQRIPDFIFEASQNSLKQVFLLLI